MCVCVCVCYSQSHLSNVRSSHKRYDLLSGQRRSEFRAVFSENAPLRENKRKSQYANEYSLTAELLHTAPRVCFHYYSCPIYSTMPNYTDVRKDTSPLNAMAMKILLHESLSSVIIVNEMGRSCEIAQVFAIGELSRRLCIMYFYRRSKGWSWWYVYTEIM